MPASLKRLLTILIAVLPPVLAVKVATGSDDFAGFLALLGTTSAMLVWCASRYRRNPNLAPTLLWVGGLIILASALLQAAHVLASGMVTAGYLEGMGTALATEGGTGRLEIPSWTPPLTVVLAGLLFTTGTTLLGIGIVWSIPAPASASGPAEELGTRPRHT